MRRLMLFPSVPRETVTSIAAMVAQTTASKEAKEISHLGNRRGLLLYSTLPCRAQRFCAITDNAYGDAMELLARHTLVAYGTCGMSPQMAEAATRNIAFGAASRTMFPRLLPGVESGNRYGLRCPECTLELLGVWFRRASLCAHCIPYVTRCPWHDCFLVCEHECSTLEMLMSKAGDKARASNSLRYAQLSCAASEVVSFEPIWPKTFGMLREKGYVTSSGRLRTEQLHTDIRKLFSAGFEDERLSYLVNDTGALDLCIQAARRTDRAAPAPILVLMYQATCEVDEVARRPARRTEEPATLTTDSERRDRSRALWTTHMNRHREMSRTQLRKSMPSVWTWLHRHDDAWLSANQVPARRRFGGRKHHELPVFVTRAISDSTLDRRAHTGGREPLPSAYQFRIAYGMSDFLFERSTTNSSAVGNAAQLPGRREVFIHKRARRALEELTQLNMPLDIATVARTARLRIATIQTVFRNTDLGLYVRERVTSAGTRPVYSQRRAVSPVSQKAQSRSQSQPVTEQSMDATQSHGTGHNPARQKRRDL